MYFKTPKNSETGKKFQNILQQIKEAQEARRILLKKYGVKRFTESWISVGGGLRAVEFFVQPDMRVWKQEKNYLPSKLYSPRLNIKIGKAIQKEFDALPFVSRAELNDCIGFDNNMHRIGSAFNNKDFFGFEISAEWGISVPHDCMEITFSEYQKLFPGKPKY